MLFKMVKISELVYDYLVDEGLLITDSASSIYKNNPLIDKHIYLKGDFVEIISKSPGNSINYIKLLYCDPKFFECLNTIIHGYCIYVACSKGYSVLSFKSV